MGFSPRGFLFFDLHLQRSSSRSLIYSQALYVDSAFMMTSGVLISSKVKAFCSSFLWIFGFLLFFHLSSSQATTLKWVLFCIFGKKKAQVLFVWCLFISTTLFHPWILHFFFNFSFWKFVTDIVWFNCFCFAEMMIFVALSIIVTMLSCLFLNRLVFFCPCR